MKDAEEDKIGMKMVEKLVLQTWQVASRTLQFGGALLKALILGFPVIRASSKEIIWPHKRRKKSIQKTCRGYGG
ncbi:hypothetical protein SLA2020_130430 [Shorea laevis]